ncbi:MAG: efflux RND transporter periplasmic adaptor subunit [Synergistaceae bacterium]|jgi:RND family efflux transporter MFP subunit|nr:efflux RND transporter periplasmic adaptor subunit [Synergistaceae bacterium]
MLPEEKNAKKIQSEIIKGRGPRVGTLIVTILILAGIGYFVRPYFMGGPEGQAAPQQAPQAAPPPSVVLHAVENVDIAAGHEYMGNVEPIQSVDIRPHVAGEILRVHFKEGSMVKEGDLLFTIDAKQYQATVDLRKADVARAEANLGRVSKYYARLKSSDSRSVSATDLDFAENDILQGKAAVAQAKASLKLAQIDLDYTKIKAPISGRIGRALFTKGNLVSPSGGALAGIVQLDPIRVSFALPDRDYLDQMDKFKSTGGSVYDTTIRLANGSLYPMKGKRDFEENAMNEDTGTMTMRLRFDNAGGMLVPGEMVKVEAKPSTPHVGPVIPQEAIVADAQGDYVYVVDGSNAAHQRRVSLGVAVGSSSEVLSGLEAGEMIIVRGLQSVKSESPVNPAPMRGAGDAKTPAERAMESGYDLEAVSADSGGPAGTNSGGVSEKPEEGKN